MPRRKLRPKMPPPKPDRTGRVNKIGRWLKRIVVVGFEGIVQHLAVIIYLSVVGIVGFVVTALVVAIGHIQGPLRDRVIGALIGTGSVVFVTTCIVIAQKIRLRMVVEVPTPSLTKGMLDYRIEAETGFSEITTVIGKMTKLQSGVSAFMGKRTKEMYREKARGANTQRLHRISSKVAKDLNKVSTKMNAARVTLDQVSSKAMSGMLGQLTLQRFSADVSEWANLRPHLATMLTITKDAITSQTGYGTAVGALNGWSQVLNTAVDHHQLIMVRFAKTMDSYTNKLQQVINQIDKRISESSVTLPVKADDPQGLQSPESPTHAD